MILTVRHPATWQCFNLTLYWFHLQVPSHFFHATQGGALRYRRGMSTSDGDGEESGNQQADQVAPRDLIDFYRRWPDFRQTAACLVDRSDLSSEERLTIHWLILLVDRISEHDLQPPELP
jgi:hypothetical protein